MEGTEARLFKPAFHDADTGTDILARILADTSIRAISWSYSCGKLNDTPTSSRLSSR